MATTVACPVCGVDGTAAANEIIAQTLAAQPAVAQVAPPVARPLARAIPGRTEAPPRPLVQAVPVAAPKAAGEFNLGLGILGAVIGALVGVGVMYGFYQWVGFRFPLLGVGIGVLTGLGARILFKGTDNTLGVVSGVIALIAVVATLFLMYGEFPIMSIISVVVSVSMAYRIASG
jgi:hypothetical protein